MKEPLQMPSVAPLSTPSVLRQEEDEHGHLFHVVLLDDDEHTYEYVIEMLQELFVLSKETAFRHALEVDSTGKTIVITCEKPEAQFACDQIHAYGADPRMPKSTGSMSAVLIPVENTHFD